MTSPDLNRIFDAVATARFFIIQLTRDRSNTAHYVWRGVLLVAQRLGQASVHVSLAWFFTRMICSLEICPDFVKGKPRWFELSAGVECGLVSVVLTVGISTRAEGVYR